MRISSLILTLSFILAMNAQFTSFAQDSSNVSMIAQMYEPIEKVNGVAIQGDFAYLASGGIRVIDISNPNNPFEVAFEEFGYRSQDIAVSEGYAYITDYNDLHVVNISDPLNLIYVNEIEVNGHAEEIEIEQNYIYLSSSEDELLIFNLNTPDHPELASILNTDERIRDISIANNCAYLAMGEDGVGIVDIADPENPIMLNSVQFGEELVSAVTTVGNTILFTTGDNNLIIADVTDPMEPVLLSNTTIYSDSRDIKVINEIACVAYNYGMQIVDIGNFESPEVLGTYRLIDQQARGIRLFVTPQYAYLAASDSGLRIIDISNPENFEEIGIYDPASDFSDVFIQGGFAYLGALENGLRIVDVNVPTTPFEVGVHYFPDYLWDIKVEDNHLYAATLDSGFRILDISDPSDPSEVASEMVNEDLAFCVEVTDDKAYVGGFDQWTFEVSQPANPTLLGRDFNLEVDFPYEIEVMVRFAFITDGDGDLQILDVLDPANPMNIGRCHVGVGGAILGLDAVLGMVFVCNYNGSLKIIDTSDLENPEVIYTYNLPGTPTHVVALNDFVYVACGEEGVYILDVSNPLEPVEVGYYNTPDNANDIAVVEPYIYVADGDYFVILDCREAIDWEALPITTTRGTIADVSTFDPIAGALVAFGDSTVFTDSLGHYTIVNLEPGFYDFEVSAEGFISHTEDNVEIVLGNNIYDVDLEPVLDVSVARGTIADASTFDPIAGALVAFGDSTVFTDSLGHYTILNLEPGLYDFEVSADGFISHTEDNVEIVLGNNIFDVDLEPASKVSKSELPHEFSVGTAYPNPFNSTISIPIQLPQSGALNVGLINTLGQMVYSKNVFLSAGQHNYSISFDGLENQLVSGSYIVQVTFLNEQINQKIIMIK
ncbi:carboxypeptidase regulatory-like domain-containing protein [bacterium]|nr:carboxypeptidase regulatory-like domain-containing protein [bacterium]